MTGKKLGQKILKSLNQAGYEAYFVGGMVRDILLGRCLYDIDIATSASPEVVLDLFPNTKATGVHYGVVTVITEGMAIEVATFRQEDNYSNHRHPDQVVFTKSLTADLIRRDFTINAMALGQDGVIIDPFNGQADLQAKVIRAVGDPKKRFSEDALRILRGVRFVSQLGFDIEAKTLMAMRENRALLADLSFERIKKELERMMNPLGYQEKALAIMVNNQFFEAVPFFNQLGKFDDLNGIKNITTLFDVIAYELENPTEFLTVFPFTKAEKKIIQTLLAIRHEVIDERLVVYRFGTNVQYRRHLLACFYQDQKFTPKLPTVTIRSRADLQVQPEDVIKRLRKPPGAWINHLFTEIEEAIVLEKIANTHASIFNFIEERGILHVEKA